MANDLEGSKLAFSLALKTPAKQLPDKTVQDTLNERFADNFLYFAACELVARQESPSDTTAFAVAVAARAMAFTSPILEEARRDSAGFETADFGGYLITFLSVLVAARYWNVPIDFVDERILSLPIPRSFEPLRKPLVQLIAGSEADAGALEDFRRAYVRVIHPAACRLGSIPNLWEDAFAWSLVKERGGTTSAVVNLFDVSLGSADPQ
jgi:hypothetical protein